MEITPHYRELKQISRETNLVTTLFPRRYSFSPYQACSHGCTYCDGRAERYYVEGDFEKDIVIRPNVVSLLETCLTKWREEGIVSIGSGVSDSYQHVERKEELMKKIAELLANYTYPVSIMTKSDLLLRDLQAWEKVHKRCGVTVMVSLVHTRDEERQHFEPYASSVEQRLSMIKSLKAQGMGVGVLVMPLLPFLGDCDLKMEELFSRLKDVDVDFAIPGGLTLRGGRQKEAYLKTLSLHYPHLLQKTKDLYAKELPSGVPRGNYLKDVYMRAVKHCKYYKLPFLFPHALYKKRLPLYDEIYVLLHHMQELYLGIDTKRLKDSSHAYTNWLLKERAYFNRRRNLRGDYLTTRLLADLESGVLQKELGNPKLVRFLEQVIFEDAVFDYPSLKLKARE